MSLYEITIAVIGALLSFGSLIITVANFGYKIHRAVVKLHEDLVEALSGVAAVQKAHDDCHASNCDEHGRIWGVVSKHDDLLRDHEGRIIVLERDDVDPPHPS